MSDSSKHKFNFSKKRLALHQMLIQQKGLNSPSVATIPPRDMTKPVPLSFAQQRLWFLDQLDPGSAVYNIPTAVRLTGLLNVGALEQSLNEIVQRHEALRTTFSAVLGEPKQVIAPTLPLTLMLIDLQELPKAKREAELRRWATQEVRRPFDLSQGPLLRASLLRLGERDHVLFLTIHHIVSDGWSMGVLFRELSVLYKAFSTGRRSLLAELPIQYADFAVWQRQWLQGEVLEEQLDYWKNQLDGAPPLLELPSDRPRPAVQKFRGAKQSIVLAKTLSEALGILSRQEGVTFYMTILAAFQTLLYRYTRQDDIVVGFPIAGRNRTEIEGLIGFLVNTLVLRTDLSENPTFRQLLRRVREVCLEAYAHQDLPFEKLVEELQPERNLSYSPLFQVMFILQNAPRSALEFPGLTLNPLEADSGTAKFDLTFSLIVGPDGLRGTLEYDTALFDSSTIERMAGHFQTLLEGIVADPEQRISELPLLTAVELHQLLVEWNDTKRDYPWDKCIHHLFEAQVERSPEAVALVFEDRQMTYEELNHRANQLAHHLQSLGVEPEVFVGISMERSIEMIVGVLGVLKAGGAYVPLDPAYPKDRIAFMIEDTQTPVLLSQNRLINRLPDHNAHLLCIDKAVKEIAQESKKNPSCGVKIDSLAYVIYTSGSTGRPKGVSMPHDSLSNLLEWQFQYINNLSDAKTLQFTTLSFDPSFQEIFSTLCSGGTLVLIPEDLRKDMRSLYHLLGDASIERLFLPFIALQLLAEAAIDQGPISLSLQEVITAGEQLQITPQIAKLFRELPDCRLYNLYGPTESHVVTAYGLMDSPDDWPLLPSIGRPISNSKIYLLDANLQPVPIGVPGELYIGGACLARGYFNQPSLTAEKFIPNPFSNNLGERLYKTGDLARYLLNGNIEFLGRIDHQVKIRGFRIEPAEIEGILGQHPAVREAIVSAVENQPGIKRLVAYVVTEKDKSPNISELRRILKTKLPDYMVPSAFVPLDALPQTPSGKVDRKSLPLPSQERPELVNEFIMPRTPIEKTIAGIWSNILKIDRVGIYDNFFELGGHSLLATQVISRLINTFRVKVTLRSLFQAPTVAELAVVITQNQVEKAESKDIDHMLAELETLSDEEARRIFGDKSVKGANRDERS